MRMKVMKCVTIFDTHIFTINFCDVILLAIRILRPTDKIIVTVKKIVQNRPSTVRLS